MKSHVVVPPTYRPTEDEIRAKAHELYVRSGWLPGRDLDNWLEAEAALAANPPHPSMAPARHAEDVFAHMPPAARKPL